MWLKPMQKEQTWPYRSAATGLQPWETGIGLTAVRQTSIKRSIHREDWLVRECNSVCVFHSTMARNTGSCMHRGLGGGRERQIDSALYVTIV